MDIDATFRFVDNNILKVNVPLITLADAITDCRRNKKPIIIYLHNEYEPFSNEFIRYISQDLIDNSNFIVWDLSGIQSEKSLVTICSLHLNCDLLENYISNLTPAVFVFNFTGDSLEWTAFYDSDTSCDLIVSRLLERSNKLDNITTMGATCNENMDTTEDFVISEEKGTITDIDLQNKTVKEALTEAGLQVISCLSEAMDISIAALRPLIIYIHNSKDNFSKSIWPVLVNKDVNDLFTHYTLYVFDINDPSDNFEFQETVMAHKALLNIGKHVMNRESCLFAFSTVNDEIEISGFFRGCIKMEEFLFEIYNIRMVHSEEKQTKFTLIEKTAIASAVNKITTMYHLENQLFTYDTIEETIKKTLLLEPEYLQKMVLIFYYNRDDEFCDKFLEALETNKWFHTVLSDSFVIIPVDVETYVYRTALKSVVNRNFDHRIMEQCIEERKGALFVITSIGTRPELLSFYTDKYDPNNLPTSLHEFSEYFQDQKKITDVVEKRVVQNFNDIYKKFLPSYFIKNNSLYEAIQENCLCTPIKNRKMLFLYYDDATHKQCTKFTCETLKDSEVQTVLKANYHFLAWDITINEKQRDCLRLAIKRCFALEKMETLLVNRIPGAFIFMPIGHTLVLFDYIDGRKQFGKSDVLKKLRKGEEFLKAEKKTEDALKNFNNEDGPVQFQQMMYNQLGNRDYDCFELQMEGMTDLLKTKLSVGLYGPPTQEVSKMDLKIKKKQDEKINDLYMKIMEQVKKFAESNEMVVMTCIFNCLIPLPKVKLERLQKIENYNPNLDFMPVPVFVLRKCVNSPEGKKPCRIYIDHDLRVYQSWELYLEDNKLPKGIFIAPKDGKYQGDHFGRVRVEYVVSPACNIGNDVLKAVDIGSAVMGMAAGVVGVAAMIPAIPVAPVVAVGAVVVGAGVGVFSLFRSSMTIHDRICHDESMSFANSQARGAYLNIVAGSLSFTGMGATYMLTYFVRNGATVGLLMRSTVTGLNGINLVTSGVAVANSAFDVLYNYITEDEAPSALTLLQLSSSILFFGHAVYSFKTANNIIEEAQYNSLREIEASLRSNRHRKTFTKLKAETIRMNGDVQTGQAEVISFMKELNNRDEVLATLTRTNKELNQSGIRYSVKDGQINFNGKLVDIGDFSNMSKMQRSEYMLNMPPMEDSKPIQVKKVQEMVTSKFNIASIANSILSGTNIVRYLSDITNIFSIYVQEKIYSLLKKLLEYIFGNVNLKDNLLKLIVGDKIPEQMLKVILQFFKELVMEQEKQCAKEGGDEALLRKRKNITRVVYLIEKAVIVSTLSVENTLKELINFTYKWMGQKIYDLATEIRQQNEAHPGVKTANECKICCGYYYT